METKLTYFKIFKEYFQFSSTFLVNPQLSMTSAKISAVKVMWDSSPGLCCANTYACARL